MSAKTNVTPMMAQYLEIKAEYPAALLFYRMGDFYELFFDDAVAASAALDIALTKRGKHDDKDIPICGVPVHAAEGYLLNLIRKGFRVAVCEQLESPAEAKKRGYKSVVKRGVVRLVTPGTLTEETLLSARQSNYLAAYTMVQDQGCLAWVDISTGEVSYSDCALVKLGPELTRLNASEILLPEGLSPTLDPILDELGVSTTPLFDTVFDSTSADEKLKAAYGTTINTAELSRAQMAALGALLEYLMMTQKGQLPLLRFPRFENQNEFVEIDAATRRNLELTQTMTGDRKGSLLHTIDQTVTAAGGRLLAQRLTTPLQNMDLINARLDGVAFFHGKSLLRDDIRRCLKAAPDLERALARLSLGRGGPRDIKSIGLALQQAFNISKILEADVPNDDLQQTCTSLQGHEALEAHLATALSDDVPMLARDGGFVASGYDARLDELRQLRDEARSVIAQIQAEYARDTEISTLKIKHNNVLGYFIETTATHSERMLSAPLSETFIHRQTTANAVRFTTVQLSELETKILNAAGEAQALELQIFDKLCAEILSHGAQLQACAAALAVLDVTSSLAEAAATKNWCRATLSNTKDLHINAGRHPVVEASLSTGSEAVFVANDCHLGADADFIWLLTGPNMAGKSTFLRQNAVIALMAQMGSFVPAASAHIGIVSQIFSRVGASDDLAKGRSTFMVEMVETAAILNQADDRALVILDEIGRGTSTYDGLSIAWATLEHLHTVNQCRSLFATHYHELTQVAEKLKNTANATVTVREWDGDVVFLHEVKKGAADRSYGVQVAKLAGLPQSVLDRAKTVLAALEKGEADRGSKPKAMIDDLPLFTATQAPAPEPSQLDKRLQGINPDMMNPKQALDLVYELVELSKRD